MPYDDLDTAERARIMLRSVDDDLDVAERDIFDLLARIPVDNSESDFSRAAGLIAAYIHTARCLLTPFIIPSEISLAPCRDDTNPPD